jgi:hypothetical protein
MHNASPRLYPVCLAVVCAVPSGRNRPANWQPAVVWGEMPGQPAWHESTRAAHITEPRSQVILKRQSTGQLVVALRGSATKNDWATSERQRSRVGLET